MNSDLSPEAHAFLASYVSDQCPTNFSRIEDIRQQVHAHFSAGAERAISRHGLVREDITVGGIVCERVTAPSAGTAGGTLVYLFGGGFIVGSPHSDMPIIGALAQWCQLEVIAPKYRLAPEHPAPAASLDCLAVWRATAEICNSPLFLAGESAGGNLALTVVQQAMAQGLRLPDAMALLSPAADLRTDAELYEPTTTSDPTLCLQQINEVLSAYGAGTDPTDPSLSPLFGPLAGMPATFITTGTRDLLLSPCLRLYRQMKRCNVDVECRVWDGLWHVFEYYDEYPESTESLQEICAFLNSKKALLPTCQ